MAFLFWSFRIFPRPQYRLSPWHTSVIRDLVLVGLAEEKVALRAHLKPWKYEAPSWKVKGEDIIYIHRHAIYLLLYIFCYRYIIYDVYIYIYYICIYVLYIYIYLRIIWLFDTRYYIFVYNYIYMPLDIRGTIYFLGYRFQDPWMTKLGSPNQRAGNVHSFPLKL